MYDILPEEWRDLIATENDVDDLSKLRDWFREKNHPIVERWEEEEEEWKRKEPGASDSEILSIVRRFRSEIKRIREWLLNSDIRAKTFYYLAILNSATASEIADKINKHPKSVSIYISEFFEEKNWIKLVPDEDSRKKRYQALDVLKSVYKIAIDEDWLDFIEEGRENIEKTVLKIDYSIGISQRTAEFETIDGEKTYKVFPDIYILIRKLNTIANKIVKKLGLNIKIPSIVPVGNKNNILEVGTIGVEELAILFGSMNYLDRNMFDFRGNTYGPGIIQIKFIPVEDYFREDIIFSHQEKGFLPIDETKGFISTILRNFRKKYNIELLY